MLRSLERDVVVEVVDRSPGAGWGGGAPRRRLVLKAAAGVTLVIAAFPRRSAGAAGAPCPIQHRQLAAEAVQHDLGRVALLAALIGPFAGLQCALEIDLRALLQVLLGDLGEPLVEDHDTG